MLVVLLLHSMLVIYSLLLSNTEDRTYEYGMLRALGLKHSSLIQLLTIQVLLLNLFIFSEPLTLHSFVGAVLLSPCHIDWVAIGLSCVYTHFVFYRILRSNGARCEHYLVCCVDWYPSWLVDAHCCQYCPYQGG